ncbi:hypothetical protein CAL7716_084990 [Calothrix sp. PCC 7716]|nr:hypothetical protein CAL7716_084990 [Calothrix sp. PCC 7716]
MKTISRVRSNTIKRSANPGLPNDKVVSGFIAAPQNIRYGSNNLKASILAVYPACGDWNPMYAVRAYSELRWANTYSRGGLIPLVRFNQSGANNFNECRYLKAPHGLSSISFGTANNKEGFSSIQESLFFSKSYIPTIDRENPVNSFNAIGSNFLYNFQTTGIGASHLSSDVTRVGAPVAFVPNKEEYYSFKLACGISRKKENTITNALKLDSQINSFASIIVPKGSAAINNTIPDINFKVNYNRLGLNQITNGFPFQYRGYLIYNNLNNVGKAQVERHLKQRAFKFKDNG